MVVLVVILCRILKTHVLLTLLDTQNKLNKNKDYEKKEVEPENDQGHPC